MSKTIVITSTINVPTFLRGLCENATLHNMDDFSIMVIGDVKTPEESRQYCNGLSREFEVEIKYLDIKDQEKAFQDYMPLWNIIPLNNNVRKMIGTFLAYMEGCERVIMVDDDNYATGNNFIGYHNIAGTTTEMDLIQSPSGWYNICESMIEKNRIPFYPRGYPWGQRFLNPALNKEKKKKRIVVNGGLVLKHPDIDAVSRLFWPIEVIAIDSDFDPYFGLSPGTWAPFNDQNTAICRELIPVYYKPPAGLRNADIWTSYIIARLAEHMGDVISFGQPLVRQIRNHHDLREDYRQEESHNRATDQFVSILRGINLTEDTYLDGLGELIGKSLECISSNSDSSEIINDQGEGEPRHQQLPSKDEQITMKRQERDMIKSFFIEYQKWHQTISGILNHQGG